MNESRLTPRLEAMNEAVKKTAFEAGLDFFPVQFYMLDFDKFNEVVANLGFPRRYMHWRFGMEYGKLKKQLGHGFGRIYELIINSNPAIAYLLAYNKDIQQKMVMAHVYGHADFFKNNMLFSKTNRNMLNSMADHAELIAYYYNKIGFDVVESFIDATLSIEDLVDPLYNWIPKNKEVRSEKKAGKEEPKIKVEPYLKEFVPDLFRKPKKEKKESPLKMENLHELDGDRDVLQFIIEKADHLKVWHKDILSIIREERCYFIPQIKTKIMNEGWATFWHARLMSEKGLAGDEGIVDFAKTHASVVRSSIPGKGSINLGFNPYTLGYMLFKDIKERWDKGRYGLAYEEEHDVRKKSEWDTGEMNGMEKIFEVRRFKSDTEFIREFFTDEFILKNMFFTYGLDESERFEIIKSRQPEIVRNNMLALLTNYGEPIIKAVSGNFKNSKSLLLKHDYAGLELNPEYTKATLKNLFKIWRRPVFLTTHVNDVKILFGYNGVDFASKEIK